MASRDKLDALETAREQAKAREILNPEVHPDRLESILKGLLGKPVRICSVLPNDSDRLGDENALVFLDIVVKLEDGRYANVEIQRIGYAFPDSGRLATGQICCLDNIKRRKVSAEKTSATCS